MKRVLLIVVSLILLVGVSACGNKETEKKEHPIVTMEIENYGSIKIELYPEYAPNTVANFVNLVEDGFYDDNNFHRLVPGFVLQGGDPDGNGTGGPGYTIKGEFSINNFDKNKITHTKGVISMARNSISYDSAGSQFFIVLDDSAKYSLDTQYAAFGRVIEGMNIIEKIEDEEEVADSKSGKLKENIKIVKTTVDTKGVKYKVVKN